MAQSSEATSPSAPPPPAWVFYRRGGRSPPPYPFFQPRTGLSTGNLLQPAELRLSLFFGSNPFYRFFLFYSLYAHVGVRSPLFSSHRRGQGRPGGGPLAVSPTLVRGPHTLSSKTEYDHLCFRWTDPSDAEPVCRRETSCSRPQSDRLCSSGPTPLDQSISFKALTPKLGCGPALFSSLCLSTVGRAADRSVVSPTFVRGRQPLSATRNSRIFVSGGPTPQVRTGLSPGTSCSRPQYDSPCS
jgi:hypothetical protein